MAFPLAATAGGLPRSFCLALALVLAGVAACATRPPMITKLVDGRLITTRSISPRAYEHAGRALMYEEEDRWEEAAAEYRRAIDYDPQSPELWARLAQALLQLDRPKDAQAAIDKSLAIETTVPGVVAAAHLHLHRGDAKAAARVLEDALGRPEWANDDSAREEVSLECADAHVMALDLGAAARRLERLLETHPTSQPALYRQAALAWATSDFAQARRYFERLVDVEPDHLEGRLLLARLLTVMDKQSEARAAYADALARSEGDLTVASFFATFLVAHGQNEEAHALAEDLQIADSDPNTLAGRMELERSAGRLERALAAADSVLASAPDKEVEGRVLYAKAAQLEAAHRFDEAVRTFSQIPEDASSFIEGRLRAVALLRERGQLPEAQQMLDGLAKKELDDPMALEATLARALLLASLGQTDAARQKLAQIPADAADKDRLRMAEATVEDKYGEKPRALAAAASVLAQDPGSVEALNFWAFVAAEQNQDLPLALKRAQAALTFDPGSPAIMDTVGWLHLKKGDLERARPFLEGAARISPDEPEIVAHVAALYEKLGNADLAVQHAKQAMALSPAAKLRAELEAQIARLGAPASAPSKTPPASPRLP